jgi:hypothetical protein
MLNKLAISNRHSLLVKIANVIRYLGEIRELAPFADDALKALKNIAGGRAGFVGSAPEALEQLAKGSDELASVVLKNPEEFLQTFKGLGAEQKFAINQLWSRLPQSNGGSVAIEEFAASAIRSADKLKANLSSIDKFIVRNPSEFLTKYNSESAFKSAVDKIWNSHPESKNFSSIEDFAKSKINPTAAPAASSSGVISQVQNTKSFEESLNILVKGDISDIKKEIEILKSSGKLNSLTVEETRLIRDALENNTVAGRYETGRYDIGGIKGEIAAINPERWQKAKEFVLLPARSGVTPAGEVVSDAGAAAARADEAVPAISRTDEALRAERAAEVAGDASSTTKSLITSETTMDEAIEIISNKKTILGEGEIKVLNKLVENPDDAAKLISAENSGKFKKFNEGYGDVELSAIIRRLGETIRANPKAAAQALTEAAQSSAPAAKAINLRRAAKIAGAVAAGLTGIALINHLWSGDEEEEEKITQSVTAPPATSSDSSLPQGGTGGYEEASAIMIDKGYLGSPQSRWTPEFDRAFREFIDAGTANNKALTKTNLVGGQTWPAVAPSLGFSGDKNGALSAVSVLSRFVPSKRGATTPVSPGTTGVPPTESGAGGRGTESPKVEVLADIISRLYNNDLVEGGGGIFSNELRQTQTFVDALGGAFTGGYINAARELLSRNPGLEALLPATKITTVLRKRNIKSHPAYEAVKETQKTIHQLFEAANPGIINPLRRKRVVKNIKEYLGISADGSQQKSAKNVTRGTSKRATEMEGYGLRKEALAPLAIAAIGIGIVAAGVWAYNYISDYGKIANVYPDLGKRTELDILARFKKELDNLWFNSDKGGVLAYDAYAYFLGFNYGYDENKLVEKLKEIGVDFGDESFEEMMNDDEDGSYYSVVHHLNKGREDRAKADKGVAAQGGPEAVVEGTKSDSSSPQGGTGYTQLVGAPGTKKIEDVSGGQKFIYTIKSPTEFSYVWLYSDGSERKSRDSVTTENFSSKWNQTAETINKLPVANDAMAKSGFSRDRFVKLAEARKAKIREEVLVSLTPAEKAVIRRNKMREI